MYTIPNRLYRFALAPKSKNVDDRRREFILNTLLGGLWIASTCALIFTAGNYLLLSLGERPSMIYVTGGFWAVNTVLLYFSRRGHWRVVALTWITTIFLTGVLCMVAWGVGLAIAQLVIILSIVMAGVLFRAKLALVLAALSVITLIVVTLLQVQLHTSPDTYWRHQEFQAEDAVGYAFIFALVGFVSWLSNREIDRSLDRARSSEKALQKQNEKLESLVIKRTKQLEELQLKRLLELQPMAEFGRIGAHLLHEITNPITAASLHLQQLDQKNSGAAIHIQRSLVQLERYVNAARKQLKRQSDVRIFSVNAEVKQVLHLLDHHARKSQVKVSSDMTPRLRLYGDPVKFSQCIANLVANAIDACALSKGTDKRLVHVSAVEQKNSIIITVSDNGGCLSKSQIAHVFEPFYTTKTTTQGGLGIGLSLVKKTIEEDFEGKVSASITNNHETNFTIMLPRRRE